MILVDTSVWIDHFRTNCIALKSLLMQGQILMHPFVIEELALGNLKNRDLILELLANLPQSLPVTETENLHFINHHRLYGLGTGYVDVHLLASAYLSKAKLWTRDKRLKNTALSLGIAASEL